MHTLIQKIHDFCEKNRLITPKSTIIIGLSGGPDSTFLIHFLKEMESLWQLTLVAAHLDHEWRDDSKDDLLFCKKLTETLNIPLINSTLNQERGAIKYNGSKEEIARKVRRQFFSHIAQKHNASHIALAHHRDDQQETFFIRLIRGSSLTGLTGMIPKNGLYIRPLLSISKAEILTYLDEQGIAYRTDSSNDSNDFLRNRIRNTVIPALQSCDARFLQNCIATIDRLQETESFLDDLAQENLETISTLNNKILEIDTNKLCHLPSTLRIRVVLKWLTNAGVIFTPTHALFDEIIRFLESPRGGSHALHPTWSIIKKKGWANIRKNFTPD